jgi:hypothetical protein
MGSKPLGLLIVALGGLVALTSLLVYSGALSWIGKIHGDVRIENGNFRFYMPLGSMIVVSVFLSLVAALPRRM